MSNYIKSHSNYVLKSKHQTINDGTIWERDITTIGGLNQFAPGQTPIYQSSNFIITVRDDRRGSNQYNTKNWERGISGDVWTLETVKQMVSDYEDEKDTKIVLKQDYYDFRDFAYYGSLTELFRSSITDIVNRFPGELFFSGQEAYYTNRHTVNGELVEETYQIGKKLVAVEQEDGSCLIVEEQDIDSEGREFIYELKNPFGINVHSQKRPTDGEILKYFADGGISNYELVNPCETINCPFDVKIDKIILICIPRCGEKCGCSNITEFSIDENCDCRSIITFSGPTPIECGCGNIDGDIDIQPKRSLRMRSINNRNAVEETCPETPQTVTLRVYVETNGTIHYMYSKSGESVDLTGYHLRPKKEFLTKFYNGSSSFEKLILDFDSSPRYKSTFSVIHENEFGYYREFETFNFPVSEGGYNPTTDEAFISKLIDIGELYDNRFTDNLWRSMTHEAIKNFDWTYTREYKEGDEIEFVAGGKKIQKALRIFAREFDEIKTYIDNIRFMNRVTYDQRSNLPDYFLSDNCEQDGWDVKYVIPYKIEERYVTGDKAGELVEDTVYTDIATQLGNAVSAGTGDEMKVSYFSREYSQDSKKPEAPEKPLKPYSKENIKDGSADGYFYDCSSNGECEFTCWLNEMYSGETGCKIRPATATTSEGSTPADECAVRYEETAILERDDNTSRITNRIKSYTDETDYSYMNVNNEFLRRLLLNSKYIWRHKGTLEGIEMILGMFGLKSKRWLDNMDSIRYNSKDACCTPTDEEPDKCNCKVAPDYEIKEYTSFAKRIEEEWDVEHQMYRIDWVNTTKTITYDYRSQSNYTLPGSIGYTGIPYQGIPVVPRYEYSGYADEKKYITYKSGDKTEYYLDENGEKIPRRYLYPYFSKTEQFDGDPYFQMDGGWLAKKITGISTATEGEEPTEEETSYNFQFDVDDNIVYNKYVPSGSVTKNGFIDDNRPLYKETIRSIKRVDTLSDLVSVSQSALHNGSIYYVNRIGRDVAVVNGQIFDITHHGNQRFVTYVRKGGFITVGDKYFDETIVVYNKDYEPTTYYIDDKLDGYEIKAYIKEEDDDFITYNFDNPAYTITSFQIISDNFEVNNAITYTNYYILDDVSFSDTIASPGDKDGWRRLKENDYEYMRINTITNYYNGNNGHNGNMVYDSGHEYFTYFNRLFKYAYDNDKFDSRCYTDGFDWLGGEVFDYGFSGLIDSNEEIKQYDKFLLEDEKIHYFGNFKENLIQVCEDPEEEGYVKPADCNNPEKLKEDGNKVRKITIYGDYHKFATQPSEGTQMTDAQVKEAAKLSVARSLNLAKKVKNEQTGESSWQIIDGIDVDFITSVTSLTTYNKENLNKIGVEDLTGVDDVTNQIVNNKRLKIIFNMKYPFNSKDGQSELKYIDDIVMNYLTQLVPSTAIFDVEYNYCEFNYDGC